MKNNKGFTLIELLAVIVILAVIENAKKGSAKVSGLGYVDVVEKQIAINLLNSDTTNYITDKVYTIEELTNKGVSIKGNLPSSGTVTILNNNIVSAELKYDNYDILIDNNGKAISNSAVYGLRWDDNNNYTRLNDAKGLTSCVGTDTTICNSDFDNAEIYREL